MMDAECTGDLVVPTAKSSERRAVWAGTMVCIPEQENNNQSDVMGPILSLLSLSPLLPTPQSSSPTPPLPIPPPHPLASSPPLSSLLFPILFTSPPHPASLY